MDRQTALSTSWETNADNWTRAVREGLIPSRKAGTDAAIVNAIVARKPARLLDVGCGEGWLVRCVTERIGCAAVGIDGSARLVEAAKAADPKNEYYVLTYRDLTSGRGLPPAGFDVIAFNYALFDEEAAALLAAVKPLLRHEGVVVIQTLHPWSLSHGEAYRDGWRTEDFSAFDSEDWAPMPWFFRTLASWHGVVRSAGLVLVDLAEPSAEPDGRPLSLLMTCGLANR